MTRLTDNDRHLGPITYAKCDGWKPWRLVYSSGGDDDDGRTQNTLTVYAFGWIARLNMPPLLQPYRIKHIAETWDATTVERLGRNWYFETHSREYGFSLNDGFLQVFLGPQTHDSTTTKSWSKFLPWTQWRPIRFSLYTPQGEHYWTQLDRDRRAGLGMFQEQMNSEEACPKSLFLLDDFDGERITATCHIEEREWRFGTGWFKWLSLFRRPKIHRSLSIRFSAEVGPEKGSWKGGTLGHGVEMEVGETPEQAFRRYCELEHHSKYRRFKITFVGAA